MGDIKKPKDYDEALSNRQGQMRSPLGNYYWIKAVVKGKAVLLGPYNNEQDAQGVGYSKCDGQFEVITLPTSNVSRASQLLKAQRMNTDGINLEQTMARLRHKGKDIGVE
ncbi:hypothetical protein LCGC14_0721260 [marine sediment metagenome]|uniref:Uncharacterized protein n=1 Tax=marine sediment metagenome TaxID=412755 RepID=A0A0F9SXR2_9ZZZZ